jgi:hypothetical protein
LETLADVLPEISTITLAQPRSSKDRSDALPTLKSKPGVAKKREKVVKEEKERFGKNLAALTHTQSNLEVTANNQNTTQTSGTNGRWAALRKHLESTVANT